VLEERLRQRRIEKYGAGSEKLSNYQLEMLEQEPGVSQQEAQAESERSVLDGEVIEVARYARKARRSHPGRQSLPADLPRGEVYGPVRTVVFLWAVTGPPIAMKTGSSDRMMTAGHEAVEGRCHSGGVEAVVVFDPERMIEPISVRQLKPSGST
jgi:Transposase C of IS166 homeodomain